jgi:REP element-mobilizing transposase RayT
MSRQCRVTNFRLPQIATQIEGMARPIRIEYAGASYHVMARGNERRAIYRGEADRGLFLETLGEMVERFGVKLHAYVLMPNHFHLLLTTPEGNLSRSVGWLQTTYTIRFNCKHHRVGHLFQGRYKAQIVDTDGYAQILVPYVHLNPIRRRTQEGIQVGRDPQVLQEYRWSSHLDYCGKGNQPLVKLDWGWLKYWGRSLQQARRFYRQEIRRMVREGTVEDPWENLTGQLILGGEEFMETIAKLVTGKKRGTEQQWGEHHDLQRRQQVVKKWVEQENDWRWQIWLRIKLGRERPIDIAREMDYRDGGSVLQVIKRLEKKESNRLKLQKYKQGLSRIDGLLP